MTSSTELKATTTVGEWVARFPRTSRIFEDLKIDYCCRGGTPLEQACRDRQLDPQAVVARLEEAIAAAEGEPSENWQGVPLADLCDHIEQTHHAYLRTELPRLTETIAKVVNAHGDSHAQLAQLMQVFAGLRAELEPHMFKEEQVLFPAIRQLEQSSTAVAFPFGTVANPIRMMEHEHDNAGEALAAIRKLMNDFAVPDDACNTYRAMLDGLEQLETNLHQHIHKENSILFPNAAQLEETKTR